MRVHEQAGLHHPGQTHKLASGHWAPCTTLEGIGLTDLLQTEGLFCTWEACGKQGPTWRTERVVVRLPIIGSFTLVHEQRCMKLIAFQGHTKIALLLVKRTFQVTPVTSPPCHFTPVLRTRNMTFEVRLTWGRNDRYLLDKCFFYRPIKVKEKKYE